MLLYGYGSYEVSIDPTFSASRVSLLDRGVVFAIAHVRGGGEMGRPWYDDGKLLHKRNTFTDFIACAEHLAAEGWTSTPRLVARGGSAGGLLMGAVVEPPAPTSVAGHHRRGAVRRLPHHHPRREPPAHDHRVGGVGRPRSTDEHLYAYLKAAYSPYDNVTTAAPYPADARDRRRERPAGQYWEPAKWVAKRLRTDDLQRRKPILLKHRARRRATAAPQRPLRRLAARRPSCSPSCSTPSTSADYSRPPAVVRGHRLGPLRCADSGEHALELHLAEAPLWPSSSSVRLLVEGLTSPSSCLPVRSPLRRWSAASRCCWPCRRGSARLDLGGPGEGSERRERCSPYVRKAIRGLLDVGRQCVEVLELAELRVEQGRRVVEVVGGQPGLAFRQDRRAEIRSASRGRGSPGPAC